MQVAAWTPLKQHSERLLDKNWQPLAGKPLFRHSIDTMLKTQSIQKVYVNCDSQHTADIVKTTYPLDRVHAFIRPRVLSDPKESTIELFLHDLVEVIEEEILVFFHCTSPLLKSSTINFALAKYQDNFPKFDSVVSATKLHERLYDCFGRAINHNPNFQLPLQDLPPVWQENNAFFIISADTAIRHHNRIGSRPMFFEIGHSESVDIDHAIDLEYAEFLLSRRKITSS